MPDQFISCPKCGHKIPLTEALSHEMEEKHRAQLAAEIQKKDAEHVRTLEAKGKEYREAFDRERTKVEAQAKKQALESVDLELKDTKSALAQKTKQLDEAQQQELNLRKRQRELEERERDLKLEVARTLDTERKKIWEEASAKASDEQRLREMEKDKQLSEMRKQIEDLKRKAELTSQQTQGEVQELELEHVLGSQFRFDEIEPVAKGTRGGDIIQHVRDEAGRVCGKILWESKRTKAWSDGWIQKLKDDQRAEKAELAVIVTSVLPKDIARFGNYEGVWVTDIASSIGLATVLRLNLIQLSYATNSMSSKNEKVEMLYQYLSGTEFRHRIEAIMESFVAMRGDLDAERNAMEKIWSKRSKQIERVLKNTTGMYGDLQGIIGTALPDVKNMQLPSGQNELDL